MDPRPSRRDKLLSFSPEQLLFIVRYKRSQRIRPKIKILESAAARGDEECAWLLDEKNITENSARAHYYQGLAASDRINGIALLRKSAKNGFVPAMGELCFVLKYNDREERVDWIRKAASLNDADGLYFLSTLTLPIDFDPLYRAAKQGQTMAILNLISLFRNRISLHESVVLCARYVLISSSDSYIGPVLKDIIASKNFDMMYVAGRELEGYQVLWNNEQPPDKLWLQCIEFYLDTIHRARRAALQTTFGLGRILGRDVARMIGKIIISKGFPS